MKKEIGTIDEFHSKRCYDLYMYGVELAKQINDYIDKGYIVIFEDEIIKTKFEFYDNEYRPEPYIKISNLIYIGYVYDNSGKVWLEREYTKKSIRDKFSKFKIVNPKDIIKIKVK